MLPPKVTAEKTTVIRRRIMDESITSKGIKTIINVMNVTGKILTNVSL